MYGELVLGGNLIGGIALKIAGRKNPCDYALIAVGLTEVMEEDTRRGRGIILKRLCIISNYAVITDGAQLICAYTNHCY